VHTYRFNGHSPADPEHERGRKEEKRWARADQDPIAIFEQYASVEKAATAEELKAIVDKVKGQVSAAYICIYIYVY
jgi:TPP-dependent pyruvate/acetoin dehydrogenase alpha subunit